MLRVEVAVVSVLVSVAGCQPVYVDGDLLAVVGPDLIRGP
jgi:hypothetical protein